jgi:hypothetical protein
MDAQSHEPKFLISAACFVAVDRVADGCGGGRGDGGSGGHAQSVAREQTGSSEMYAAALRTSADNSKRFLCSVLIALAGGIEYGGET